MKYRGYLDISQAVISENGAFLYVTIDLHEALPSDAQARYAVEIDTDEDGRGDWLVSAQAPSDTEWTVQGVLACRDLDEDVGGATPMRADTPSESLTGYEDCVFDSGVGISPDEAWVRLEPGALDRVQIALLHSLIGSDANFVWGVWAAELGSLDPEHFDYHDRLTLVEAGSPIGNNENYPLKALALVDNTCRWTFGFTPSGSEPGICLLPPTATPEPVDNTCVKPPRPSSDSCWIWVADKCEWQCFN